MKATVYIVRCRCTHARVPFPSYTAERDAFDFFHGVMSYTCQNTRCWQCGYAFKFNELKAKRNDTKCDARCTEAKGHCCECSCGGKNHGAGDVEAVAA